ncbi:hypothetical protein UlMin_019296 [Ulmus minor]
MAVSFNSVVGFPSTLQAKCHNVSKSSGGVSMPNACQLSSFLGSFGSKRLVKEKRKLSHLSVADSDRLNTETSDNSSTQVQTSASNGLPVSSNQEETLSPSSSPDQQGKPKRSPLTARERLRAARVLNRYTESKPSSKSEMGSKVLDAIRESDRGKKKGLPEAPGNMLDDSKRGLSPAGFTFDFPGGNDLFVVVFSFVFISTVMFATTYLVWKVGAIHFNEY